MDLASQGVLAVADRHIKRHDARYPVGRARLEALGVLGCATIMSMAAVEVIQFSVRWSLCCFALTLVHWYGVEYVWFKPDRRVLACALTSTRVHGTID